MGVIFRLNDAVNRRLALFAARMVGGSDGVEVAAAGIDSGDAVEERHLYLMALFLSWLGLAVLLIPVFGATLALIPHHGGDNRFGVSVFVFAFVACLVGGLDGFWRFVCVSGVNKRYSPSSPTLSDLDRWQMRMSSLRFPTIVVQLVVGLLVAALSYR